MSNCVCHVVGVRGDGVRVAFRVDASVKIGTGHLMRCLTLADGLTAKGATSHFVARDLPSPLQQLVLERGHALSVLRSRAGAEAHGDLGHSAWLSVSQDLDATETRAALKDGSWDWLVVDHYALDWRWELRLKKVAKRILVIDDLADRRHECDVLLDQNIVFEQETRYCALVPETCLTLLGPRYALLHPSYAEFRARIQPRAGRIKRVLVYLGGADKHNITAKVIKAWLSLRPEDAELDVVLPALGEHTKTLCELAAGDSHIHIYHSLPSLVTLIAQADLCIGASGATNWERLCLGLPTFVVTLAENQIPIARALELQGLVRVIGDGPSINDQLIADKLRPILAGGLDPSWSSACLERVDGRGVQRICDVLTADRDSLLQARPAKAEDESLLFFWANDPDTRRNGFNPGRITLQEHQAWLTRRLACPAHSGLYVVETREAGFPIGQVRFDVDGSECEISYSLGRIFRGRGMAGVLLLAAIEEWHERTGLDKGMLFVLTKEDNVASQRTLLTLGFEESEDERQGVKRYRYPGRKQ